MSGRDCVNRLSYFAVIVFCTSLFSLPALGSETAELNLNLDLQHTRILPPIMDSYSSADYMSLYENESGMVISSKRQYPLGLVRFKADKRMRVRGWEVMDNIYFGQAKVGRKWGVGLVVDRGTHYYGLNNRGVSFLKKF